MEIAKQVTCGSGTYSRLFDYCAGRCRHNSESVVHENAYLSEFYHCFALPSDNSVAINNTQTEYMKCKGSCLASICADQPAEDAPRNLNPGACLYMRRPSMLSCDGFRQHTRRKYQTLF
ncbi:putative SREBP regulating gene protein [Helianthus anomalus]